MVTKIVCVVVLACIFQCVLALILSSRAAGPMYRLRKYLLNVSQGVPPEPIQFREHDSFHNVQDAYNEMVKVLEKERLNDLRIIQQMEDGIASLKIAAKDEYTFQLADYIERLNNDLKNFKTH